MIESATQFVRLQTSTRKDDYGRATNDEAPTEVWLEVIQNFPAMRKWVAHNKSVPLDVLDILSRDHDPLVRWWVATHKNLTEEMQVRLAGDTDYTVREQICMNASSKRRALEQLAQDANEGVAVRAKYRLKTGDFVP